MLPFFFSQLFPFITILIFSFLGFFFTSEDAHRLWMPHCITDMLVNHWPFINFLFINIYGLFKCDLYLFIYIHMHGEYTFSENNLVMRTLFGFQYANVKGRTIKFLYQIVWVFFFAIVGFSFFGIQASSKCFRNLSPIHKHTFWRK